MTEDVVSIGKIFVAVAFEKKDKLLIISVIDSVLPFLSLQPVLSFIISYVVVKECFLSS